MKMQMILLIAEKNGVKLMTIEQNEQHRTQQHNSYSSKNRDEEDDDGGAAVDRARRNGVSDDDRGKVKLSLITEKEW